MIDYLEAVAGEEADALLEAERWLEAALAGLEGAAGSQGAQRADETVVSSKRGESGGEESPLLTGSSGLEGLRFQGNLPAREELPAQDQRPGDQAQAWELEDSLSGEPGGTEGELEPLPLAAELERLDAALAGGVRSGMEGTDMARTAEYGPPNGARSAGRAGTGRIYGLAEPGGRSAGAQSAGQLSLTENALDAERLDQLFRRDSRRYDGGFFLY